MHYIASSVVIADVLIAFREIGHDVIHPVRVVKQQPSHLEHIYYRMISNRVQSTGSNRRLHNVHMVYSLRSPGKRIVLIQDWGERFEIQKVFLGKCIWRIVCKILNVWFRSQYTLAVSVYELLSLGNNFFHFILLVRFDYCLTTNGLALCYLYCRYCWFWFWNEQSLSEWTAIREKAVREEWFQDQCR